MRQNYVHQHILLSWEKHIQKFSRSFTFWRISGEFWIFLCVKHFFFLFSGEKNSAELIFLQVEKKLDNFYCSFEKLRDFLSFSRRKLCLTGTWTLLELFLASFSTRNKYCRSFFSLMVETKSVIFVVILSLTRRGWSAPTTRSRNIHILSQMCFVFFLLFAQ